MGVSPNAVSPRKGYKRLYLLRDFAKITISVILLDKNNALFHTVLHNKKLKNPGGGVR
jgi:hypothetical protein